jgi:hypothetical protein
MIGPEDVPKGTEGTAGPAATKIGSSRAINPAAQRFRFDVRVAATEFAGRILGAGGWAITGRSANHRCALFIGSQTSCCAALGSDIRSEEQGVRSFASPDSIIPNLPPLGESHAVGFLGGILKNKSKSGTGGRR